MIGQCMRAVLGVVVLFAVASHITGATTEAEEPMLRLDATFDVDAVETRDVQLSRNGHALRLATGHRVDWPGITLVAPEGHWNLSSHGYIAVDVENVGDTTVEACCRVDNPGADGVQNCLTERVALEPGKKQTLRVPLVKRMPEHLKGKLFGMRGYPGGWNERSGVDPANVTQLLFFVTKPTVDHTFEISNLRAGGEASELTTLDVEDLFPLIDRFGQYTHKDWPGKTRSADDFTRRIQEEAADLAAQAIPDGWNTYGGWQAGPQRDATGRFRVEKHQGKWWLVDPDGRLFWSHGADCVRASTGYTPITDREHWFADLPAKDGPFGQFYGRGSWAPHGYYQDKGAYETYNFTGANLLRKYGADWKQQFNRLSHVRLRSWGMNTIGNWSDAEIYLMRKTPYVTTINAPAKNIEGSEGYWGKFPDPFDPSFEQSLRRRLEGEKGNAVGDPWCIGYFIGNELSWGNDGSLAEAALASPADQAAKRAFIDELKKKYETIDRLNQAWATNHDSWDALRESTTVPDRHKAGDDLGAFYSKIAEQYFRCCRDAVKQVDPNGLYLGCRFAWANDRAVRAAAEYCDVVSFNRYAYSVTEFGLPEGVDKPVVIGEFHFGALDRGMFHTGLRPVESQEKRAEAYRSYVNGALDNPLIVGTHWFQFGEQATTGRGDGENYQIGLLDICDTPYPETIEALRNVGYDMYRRRLGGGEKGE